MFHHVFRFRFREALEKEGHLYIALLFSQNFQEQEEGIYSAYSVKVYTEDSFM